MLNFLSRIDRYMANNMREHGRYLLDLKAIDGAGAARPNDRRYDEVNSAGRAPDGKPSPSGK